MRVGEAWRTMPEQLDGGVCQTVCRTMGSLDHHGLTGSLCAQNSVFGFSD